MRWMLVTVTSSWAWETVAAAYMLQTALCQMATYWPVMAGPWLSPSAACLVRRTWASTERARREAVRGQGALEEGEGEGAEMRELVREEWVSEERGQAGREEGRGGQEV